MQILVLGASQGTGALCVKSALAKGHSVSAFSRTPAKLDVTHPALTKVAGDFHDAASVRSAVAGHDAVIICASPSSLGAIKEKPDYFSRGTKYCIDAMKEYGVKRLVVLSAHGVGETNQRAIDDLPRRRRRLHGRGVRVDDVAGQGRAARRVTVETPTYLAHGIFLMAVVKNRPARG